MTALRAPSAFCYELKKVEDRLLIEGKCLHCGATRVVSAFDHSLEQWEEQHYCAKQGKSHDVEKGQLIAIKTSVKKSLFLSQVKQADKD